ncbi:hypothetical protein TWF192_007771 [Orbilia oligospora]|uniref:JmjC domain-containing protein n=1 Tax=Orbilia oligospora TaxID=2813651 RepID=A0A6G1M3P1_ORBOL|nr:hypothetical protein TWF679_007238 [Orbilia oligospora]KAF3227810.1 hypothetical protein TWF191_003332 [Orbilia oligospora]KAF3244477.1 hypothetical protein TWF192_007771 [Orbilia oligospora]
MSSNHPLLDLWDSFLPSLRSIVAPLLHEPDRKILIDDEYVLLNDETFRELKLSHEILHPHALTFTIILSTPLQTLTATFLKTTLTASTILLREAERNVNTLQYASEGKRWRSTYSYTAVLISIAILAFLIHDETSNTQNSGIQRDEDLVEKKVEGWNWQDVIYHLDFALIKTSGWPVTGYIHEFLNFVDTKLLRLIDQSHNLPIDWDKRENNWCSWIEPSEPMLKSIGREFNSPSIDQWRELYTQRKPVKLTSIIDHWPVFDIPSSNGVYKSKWSSFQYILSKTINGRRIVPVEIGRTYADPDLKQRILTFKYFFSNYFVRGAPGRDGTDTERREEEEEEEEEGGGVFGYLAQHNLLTQIPSLRDDICIPEYINYTSENDNEDDDEDVATTINAWFGPANTITPLHTDNYHNIFCQVVGRKYVRLYPPEAREAMFPMGKDERGVDMGNTSSIPVTWVEGEDSEPMHTGEDGDYEKWQKFKNETYVEFVVGPGEAVFFPKGWWHYVRSVEASFSVNFWWGGGS